MLRWQGERRRFGGNTSQVAGTLPLIGCVVAGLGPKCRRFRGDTSLVAWRSVAGLQKMADLRRYLPPVADLRRSSAEKRRPATYRARPCDTSCPDLRRIVPGPATLRAQTCDFLGGNNNGRGIVSHGEGRVRSASRVCSAAITSERTAKKRHVTARQKTIMASCAVHLSKNVYICT